MFKWCKYSIYWFIDLLIEDWLIEDWSKTNDDQTLDLRQNGFWPDAITTRFILQVGNQGIIIRFRSLTWWWCNKRIQFPQGNVSIAALSCNCQVLVFSILCLIHFSCWRTLTWKIINRKKKLIRFKENSKMNWILWINDISNYICK